MITTLRDYESSIAEALIDPGLPYPANHFAFRRVLDAIGERPVSVLEIGVGEGNALPLFAGLGHDVHGFDNSASAVRACHERMQAMGLDPARVFEADVREESTYASFLGDRRFDVVIAMGVLPHAESPANVIASITRLVRPGGHVFLEFRNALFSLTTFNRYSHDFIVDTLLADVEPRLRESVAEDLAPRLEMGIPSGSTSTSGFHVPFEVLAMAESLGLEDPRIIPFHFHAGMPYLGARDPEAYRRASVALEDDTSGWRGWVLASAFLLHFRRPASGER